ncbi:MAG: RagB/SusD family nutrient uptake outer membrane protein [Bacteroidales bacterium]|nr:RagB/SusD family nutrient uptake outer membrane protein [Bacteroidales bacterium]
MKRINYICLMLLLVLGVTSCDKVLDKQPLTSFTNDNFWTSEANVELYANYFYNEWTGYGNGSSTSSDFYFATLNDNQAASGFARFTQNVPASDGTWSGCYTEIRRANIMIEKIPGIASMNEPAKNHWLGVARLYRAWQHFCLVRRFGDAVIVDKALNVGQEDKDAYLYAPRADRNKVMDFVLEDLNFAVANINKNASSRTAYNVNVANAIKSRICLFEGTYAKYHQNDASRANTWLAESKKASEAIMGNSMFSLNDSYRANYNSDDLSKNPEMIMYKKYVYGVLAHSLISYTCSSTQLHGMSKDAFDAYLFVDGLPKATTGEDTNDKGTVNENGQIDIQALLDVRDPRLAETIDHILMPRGNGYKRYDAGMVSTSSTGYGICKYDTPIYAATDRNTTGRNQTDGPIFWLAEILLNYAEACAEMGNCSKSDLDKSINLLRARAGMPDLSVEPVADPANNHGVSNLIWEIRRERRIELMFDLKDRYWSLIRWKQLDKLDNGLYPDQTRGAWIGESIPEGANVDAEGYIDASTGLTRTFDNKYYFEPIPSGQIQLNPQLSQNPGW